MSLTFIQLLEIALGSQGYEHGLPVQIETSDEEQPQLFSGTMGELLEKLQSACQSAKLQGEREAYVRLLTAGLQVTCPACERLLTPENRLSEDVVICESCRYGQS